MKAHTLSDHIITGEILAIGLAEAAHLCGVLFGWPFSRCTLLFCVLAGAAVIILAAFFMIKKYMPDRLPGMFHRQEPELTSENRHSVFLCVFFLATVLLQLIFIFKGDTVYVDRDMTVETVESFLASDSLYQVNPMTGLSYQVGMPLRLKILCLPTLYGSLCRVTGLTAVTVVWRIIPMITLISSYMAFGALGRCLFPGEGKKRICFLTAVSLIMWVGTYLYGMDGFGLLYCGWRGVSIRNCVLVPWLLSLCLRKKWRSGLLCVAAEACITWTLYGCGACAAVLLGMTLAGLCCRVFYGRERTE